jgi:hypothetical protein
MGSTEVPVMMLMFAITEYTEAANGDASIIRKYFTSVP